MLNVGIDVSAFDSAYRNIACKVEIYFDGIDKPPMIITKDDYLVDCHLLEETSAESDSPLGAVSANELTLTLLNRNQIFSVLNTKSPYASKINIGLVIKAYVQPTHCTADNWVPLGTSYVTDWTCSLGSPNAEVTCADRLLLLGQQDMPIVPAQKNLTFTNFLHVFFDAVNLVENVDYQIDSNLTMPLKYAWFPNSKVLDFLQQIAQAGLCLIFVDRFNKIQIKSLVNVAQSVTDITDQNQIVDTTVPQSIVHTYTGVNIQYNNPYITDAHAIVTGTDVSIPTGVFALPKMLTNQESINDIAYIELLNADGVDVVSFSYDSWGINAILNNTTGAVAKITINVYGRTISNSMSSIIKTDDSNKNITRPKILTVDNPYIQDLAFATNMATTLLKYVMAYDAYVELNARGNPLLELDDVVHISSEIEQVDLNAKLLRCSYTYDGALSCEIKAINTRILT